MGHKSSESEDSECHQQPGTGFRGQVGSQMRAWHIVSIVCCIWTVKVRRNRESLCKEILCRIRSRSEGKGGRGRKGCWKNGGKAQSTQRQPTLPHRLKEQRSSVLPATNIQECETHQVMSACEQLGVWDSCWAWRPRCSIRYEQRVFLSNTLISYSWEYYNKLII